MQVRVLRRRQRMQRIAQVQFCQIRQRAQCCANVNFTGDM
jgi:hypothetical protein